MTLKVLLEVPVSPYMGYGNDGIGIVQAMSRAGIDVRLQPSSVQSPLPAEVLYALSKERDAPFDLILRHENPANLAGIGPELKSAARYGLVGWSMWEWSNFSNLAGRSKLKKGLANYDALVAYDDVTASCFRDHYAGPVITHQGGYDPTPWPASSTRDWDSREFRFAQIGVLTSRKNPFATIAAFQAARERDPEFRRWARLMMKTSAPGLHSALQTMFQDTDEDGNTFDSMRLYYEMWPTETVRDFYDHAHVLVAPSRGEGKNLPALEAMTTGIPVIATAWGGHMQWMDSSFAYPLNYELKADNPKFPQALSAEADVEHLTELMLHAFHNRAEVKRKGELAASVIPQMANWDSVVDRLFRKLRTALPQGEELWLKYQMGLHE